VGTGVTRRNLDIARVPLCIRPRGAPRGWLYVAHTFSLVDDWLAAERSSFALYLSEDLDERSILRWDYEREPDHQLYPEAHIQIDADSESWRRLLVDAGRPTDPVVNLHLPVGGRRFRPSLEDVLEFLIVERLAEPRDGWQTVVEEHRREWYEIQLKAAIRRDPDLAREVLADLEGE
jgi:hypothetical protein